MVDAGTGREDGNLEVLQQRDMQNQTLARQSSRRTKSNLVGNEKASPAKGPNEKIVVVATKVPSPGVHPSNTGQHHRSYRESNASEKRDMFKDNKGATESRRLQTPINLFEDECVFCHSFRTSEFHGPMVQYLKGRIVPSGKGNPTNTIYVHKKCMEWAPRVCFNGDTIMNMEKEISRASKLRCSRCRLPGAALGCYFEHCTNTFHVPCAVMIPDCRWDVDNHNVLCPEHAFMAMACDEMSLPIKESDHSSSALQNHSSQCSVKEEISIDCQTEHKQIDQLIASNCSVLGQCLDKQGNPAIHKREEQQVDHLNTSSSSLPQGHCSEKVGISTDYQREEKQIDQASTFRSCRTDQQVLLGSNLSASEKGFLKDFASLTNATVAEKWDKNVTHVIVGRDAGIACSRSYEVLMAILSGKWVVTAGWIVDCFGELIPGPETCSRDLIPGAETSYEVEFFHGSRTSIDGPKRGRTGAAEGAPRLFRGLYFYLSAYMNSEDREHIQDLITGAEGQVLEGSRRHSLCKNLDINPVKLYFVYDGDPPRKFGSSFPLDLRKEIEEGIEYAASGAQVISHLMVFNAIASYDAQILERSDHFTPNIDA